MFRGCVHRFMHVVCTLQCHAWRGVRTRAISSSHPYTCTSLSTPRGQWSTHLNVTLGTSLSDSRRSLVTGDVGGRRTWSHSSMATRSYECPSEAWTGSRITSVVIGHLKLCGVSAMMPHCAVVTVHACSGHLVFHLSVRPAHAWFARHH